MRAGCTSRYIWLAAGVMSACLSLPALSSAQGNNNAPVSNQLSKADADQANEHLNETYLRQHSGDPKEEAAYQAFVKATRTQRRSNLATRFS